MHAFVVNIFQLHGAVSTKYARIGDKRAPAGYRLAMVPTAVGPAATAAHQQQPIRAVLKNNYAVRIAMTTALK